MDRRNRSTIGMGLLLVLLGGFFLAVQLYPPLEAWMQANFAWPWYIIGAGILMLLFGLIVNAPGMAIPAAIVGGIGGILYYQNVTGDWTSWSYMWSLIPGFVGVGILLAELLEGKGRRAFNDGLPLVVISAALFLVFGSFLGGPVTLGKYWPVLLILLGLWVMLQPLLHRRSES